MYKTIECAGDDDRLGARYRYRQEVLQVMTRDDVTIDTIVEIDGRYYIDASVALDDDSTAVLRFAVDADRAASEAFDALRTAVVAMVRARLRDAVGDA